MKLYIANDSKQTLGGGWTFLANLVQGLQRVDDVELCYDYSEADTVLLPSSSMVNPATVEKCSNEGKKIFLRIDNMPRNSRNRNTGSSRLAQYARIADGVIFQSQWAKEYIGWWLENIEDISLKGRTTVIINGVDLAVFNRKNQAHNNNIYLYSRYNKDETKRWEEAWYQFQMIWRENRNARLWIVGRFSKEQIEYGFDFFQGERIEYKGTVSNPHEMSGILKQVGTLIAPYFNDACSNAVLEARACGCKVLTNTSGGMPDVMDENLDISLERMTKEYIMFMNGGKW